MSHDIHGNKIDSDSITAQQVVTLNLHMGKLSLKDQFFAKNLLKAYHAGKATHKQRYWIGIMANRAHDIALDKPVTNPLESKVSLGDFANVYELFQKAKEALQFPKIKLKLPEYQDGEQVGDGEYKKSSKGGGTLQLAVAGPKSKYHGDIMVTNGGTWGDNKWYGVILKTGHFSTSKTYGTEPEYVKQDMVGLLTQLAKEPAKVAALYGKQTGHCCFCQKTLSDPQSLHVGYGPVCADKWGLPHGHATVPLGTVVLGDGSKITINKGMVAGLKVGDQVKFSPGGGAAKVVKIVGQPTKEKFIFPMHYTTEDMEVKPMENPKLSVTPRARKEYLF